jgi:hypothetical protein
MVGLETGNQIKKDRTNKVIQNFKQMTFLDEIKNVKGRKAKQKTRIHRE